MQAICRSSIIAIMEIEGFFDKSISLIFVGAFVLGWIVVIYYTLANKKYDSSKEEKLKKKLRHLYHAKPFYTIIVIVIITIIVLWWLNRPVEMIYDANAPPY
jgi:Na+/H+ antiporter NhaC